MVDKRTRDPEGKRQALLEAALREFSDKGVAGARTSEIAARAGVNKQLISHYFGGKHGLYEALIESWLSDEAEFAGDDATLAELAGRYVRKGVDHRPLHRLLLRASLDDEDETGSLTAQDLANVQRRQAAGEITDALDARFVILALRALASMSLMFPGDVRRLLDADPESESVVEWHAGQLERLVELLHPPKQG